MASISATTIIAIDENLTLVYPSQLTSISLGSPSFSDHNRYRLDEGI
jgi:hypothetical protein